jgi:anti-anti-sigma factor
MLIRRLAQDALVEPGADGGTTVRFRVASRDVVPEPAAPRRPDGAAPESADVSVYPDEPGGPVVVLSGELDLASVPGVAPTLFTAVTSAGPGTVTLDLRGVGYLASAGVGLVLEADARARAAGGNLKVLVAPSGRPARILALIGLDRVVTVTPGEQPAVL